MQGQSIWNLILEILTLEIMNNIGKMHYLLIFALLYREKVLEVTPVDDSGQYF